VRGHVISSDRLVLDGGRPLPKVPSNQSFPAERVGVGTYYTSKASPYGALSSLVSTTDYRITSLEFVAGPPTISESNVISFEGREEARVTTRPC
jgi:hypothetical protein